MIKRHPVKTFQENLEMTGNSTYLDDEYEHYG
jgi:hypothetical protein